MSTVVHKVLPTTFRKDRGSGRTFHVTMSTGRPDRESDRVGVSGWEIPAHVPLLWQHNRDELPLGKVRDVAVRSDALRGVIEFPPVGIYGKADTVADLIDAGIIASTSVGFVALEKPRRNDLGGLDFVGPKELLELSIVNLPANVEARIDRQLDLSAMQDWLDDHADEIVLEVDDAPDGDIALEDVAAVWREAMSAAVREALRGNRRGLAAAGDPLGDPAAHVDVDLADVRQTIRDTLPTLVLDALRDAVAREVAGALRRARGRVD